LSETIHRRPNEQKYRGYTARCKPLVSYKNRMPKLQFAKKYLKEPAELWKKGLTDIFLNTKNVNPMFTG